MGKLCIGVGLIPKARVISEDLCIGCGICVQEVPVRANADQPAQEPREGDDAPLRTQRVQAAQAAHAPRGGVLGLVGSNGTGKSTALESSPGSSSPTSESSRRRPTGRRSSSTLTTLELQEYLTRILEDDIKALIKPQYVDHILQAVKGQVLQTLQDRDDRGKVAELVDELDLEDVLDRDVKRSPAASCRGSPSSSPCRTPTCTCSTSRPRTSTSSRGSRRRGSSDRFCTSRSTSSSWSTTSPSSTTSPTSSAASTASPARTAW